MSINIPKNTLIVVADGGKATMYRNMSDTGIQLESDMKMSQEFLYTKGAASMPTESTPGEVDEATFAKHIADRLYKQAHAGSYKSLVLIADAQTLGQIRPSLHKEVQSRIVCELPKDLTNSTTKDIEKILQAA